jgi:hypothetical protein
MRPYLEKNPSQKRACGMAEGIGLEFKLQYQEKKKIKMVNFVLRTFYHEKIKSIVQLEIKFT